MAEEKKGFFKRLAEGLSKTRNNIVAGIDAVFHGFSSIDDDFYDEIEEILVMGDIGINATTAIIENLKPSPFCLLDEIEAALDDSNVGRFANYLHKLTKNTQFIVITHRRGTMAAADRLYGITMQEKGVSALVSVNLIEESLA